MELGEGAAGRVPPPFRFSRLARSYLAIMGEPMLWGLERRQLSRLLARTGWHLEQCPRPEVLYRRYLSPLQIAAPTSPTFERFVEARPAVSMR